MLGMLQFRQVVAMLTSIVVISGSRITWGSCAISYVSRHAMLTSRSMFIARLQGRLQRHDISVDLTRTSTTVCLNVCC